MLLLYRFIRMQPRALSELAYLTILFFLFKWLLPRTLVEFTELGILSLVYFLFKMSPQTLLELCILPVVFSLKWLSPETLVEVSNLGILTLVHFCWKWKSPGIFFKRFASMELCILQCLFFIFKWLSSRALVELVVLTLVIFIYKFLSPRTIGSFYLILRLSCFSLSFFSNSPRQFYLASDSVGCLLTFVLFIFTWLPPRIIKKPCSVPPPPPPAIDFATEWLDECNRVCPKSVDYATQCPKGHMLAPFADVSRSAPPHRLTCRTCHAFTEREHASAWVMCSVTDCCSGYAVCGTCVRVLLQAPAAATGSDDVPSLVRVVSLCRRAFCSTSPRCIIRFNLRLTCRASRCSICV